MFGSDITENDNLIFDVKGIYNKNKLSFVKDDIKYNIKLLDSEIIMIREGKDYINSFIFNKKKGISTYTLKDNNYTIEMDIDIKEIIIDNDFYVKYVICDTSCLYEFKLEMSECL